MFGKRRPPRLAALVTIGLFAVAVPLLGAAGRVDFNRDVRPILAENCFNCHGFDEKTRKAGLRLDVKEDALKGGQSGQPALVAGQPSASHLVARIRTTDPDDVMPPPATGRQLTPAQVATLERWVAEGAEYLPHWAFLKPQRPPVPAVRQAAWPRNPLDHFVLARLEQEGLPPRPEADPETLIRRASLDLTGLPPRPEEIDAFLADRRPEAYEKLVDRLLASTRYGERMAVDWLDAARYADTHGYHIDSARDMTPWRDWVIRAFNQNQPFDQFTVEQLAGDLLPGATREQKIASGFNRNHMINYEGGAIPEEYHTAYLVDRINTTATVWLGLTMACAQCHDHKYDPLTMRDYYGMYAIFNNVPENGLDGRYGNAVPVVKLSESSHEAELARRDQLLRTAEALLRNPPAAVDAAQAAWELGAGSTPPPAWVQTLPEEVRRALDAPADRRTDDQRATLRRHYREKISPEMKTLRDEVAARRRSREEFERSLPTSMIMAEMEKPRETFLLVRGQYDKRGDAVGPRTPAALPPLSEGLPPNRLGLARWLVGPDQPLTARVTVNRFWQLYFGNGLVKSAENFGTQGDLPTHPDLLDWLATEFVRTGWDVKGLQKLILMSATYRQSSQAPRELYGQDPENRLLARGPRLRLQAEFVRDLALAASGLLEDRVGGASVFPYQPAGLWEELMSREDNDAFTAQKYVPSRGADLFRRSLYTFIKRTSPHPQLSTFDAPDRQVCTVRRPRTNTPLQALALMNDPTYVEAARQLATRVLAASADDRERVTRAFRLATGRRPRPAEVDVLLRLQAEQLAVFRRDPGAASRLLQVGDSPPSPHDPAVLAAWTVVTSAILNLDETITKG
ncbi:MAG: DUF1553 domain-containing protein [Verrucomicrobiota bacterium]